MSRHRRPSPAPPPPANSGPAGRWAIKIAASVAAVGLLVGGFVLAKRFQPARAAPPANVLLITLDTTRADRLGAYGYRRARTPRLDRFAAESVLFEHALTSVPITLPAHASLLTGRYPFGHGVRNNGNFVLAADVPTLATTLSAKGYRTAAFVSAFVLDRRFGLARGFADYDDRLDPSSSATERSDLERRGDRTAEAFLAWLARPAAGGGGATTGAREPPFFAWVHLYDPHEPYAPPEPFRLEAGAPTYDDEIAFVDRAIGSILDGLTALGLDRTTIVAIVGDHGESLGEHDEATHAMFVYDAVLRVPLMLRWSGHLAPTRVSRPVRTIDLAPSVVELTEASTMAGDGTSLVAAMRGAAAGPFSAYAETYFPLYYMDWAPLRAIRDERWKLIDAPEVELYDLASDPGETRNVAASEPSRTAALKRVLDELARAETGAPPTAAMDRDVAEKLAALGYVSPGAPTTASAPSATKPDPKRVIGVFNQLRQGNGALAAGRAADAAATAADVLARQPGNAFATLLLARANMLLGRYREALDGLRTYVARVPTSADAHHWMALCALRLGDRAVALAEEDAAVAIDGRYVDALALRAGLLVSAGRIEESLAGVKSALDADPANAALRVVLGDTLADAQMATEAEAQYREAIRLAPTSPGAHAGLGILLSTRNALPEAAEELQRALSLQPAAEEARFELAAVYERQRREADARALYQGLAADPTTRTDLREAARQRLGALGSSPRSH